jgi:hypothetical protein
MRQIPFVLLLLSFSLLGACESKIALPFLPPTPVPERQEPPVESPEEIRKRIDAFPAEYRIIVDAETAITFASPSPLADWAAAAWLSHIPSMSTVGLDWEGKVRYENFRSKAGQVRLEQLLKDAELMSDVRTRINSIWGRHP